MLLRNESLWYGNWNRHVCCKWKCEIDHPSRKTTGLNPGKKQNCYSLSYLWSQVQQDPSYPGSSQNLGCLWTKYYRCTCMWNWMCNNATPNTLKYLYASCYLGPHLTRRVTYSGHSVRLSVLLSVYLSVKKL